MKVSGLRSQGHIAWFTMKENWAYWSNLSGYLKEELKLRHLCGLGLCNEGEKRENELINKITQHNSQRLENLLHGIGSDNFCQWAIQQLKQGKRSPDDIWELIQNGHLHLGVAHFHLVAKTMIENMEKKTVPKRLLKTKGKHFIAEDQRLVIQQALSFFSSPPNIK